MVSTLLNLISESKDFISEDIRGKYFQSILDPLIIFYNPDFIEPDKTNKFESSIFAWIPIGERFCNIPLNEAHLYIQISQESFEKIKELYEKGLITDIEKEHLNNKTHKANLSAKQFIPGR